jgi:hypothetical protein
MWMETWKKMGGTVGLKEFDYKTGEKSADLVEKVAPLENQLPASAAVA